MYPIIRNIVRQYYSTIIDFISVKVVTGEIISHHGEVTRVSIIQEFTDHFNCYNSLSFIIHLHAFQSNGQLEHIL